MGKVSNSVKENYAPQKASMSKNTLDNLEAVAAGLTVGHTYVIPRQEVHGVPNPMRPGTVSNKVFCLEYDNNNELVSVRSMSRSVLVGMNLGIVRKGEDMPEITAIVNDAGLHRPVSGSYQRNNTGTLNERKHTDYSSIIDTCAYTVNERARVYQPKFDETPKGFDMKVDGDLLELSEVAAYLGEIKPYDGKFTKKQLTDYFGESNVSEWMSEAL